MQVFYPLIVLFIIITKANEIVIVNNSDNNVTDSVPNPMPNPVPTITNISISTSIGTNNNGYDAKEIILYCFFAICLVSCFIPIICWAYYQCKED